MLTTTERELIHELGQIWVKFAEIVDNGPTRNHDLGEAVIHIHALQHLVMAQSAARLYPTELRLLGSVVQPEEPVDVEPPL